MQLGHQQIFLEDPQLACRCRVYLCWQISITLFVAEMTKHRYGFENNAPSIMQPVDETPSLTQQVRKISL